mmetsp:Transcript_34147/g.74976  ORF Transcript_34147/g.74976 Transcript_34147/m.74976 type:complete len:584 (+) Transcript_34147:951-2702(+)
MNRACVIDPEPARDVVLPKVGERAMFGPAAEDKGGAAVEHKRVLGTASVLRRYRHVVPRLESKHVLAALAPVLLPPRRGDSPEELDRVDGVLLLWREAVLGNSLDEALRDGRVHAGRLVQVAQTAAQILDGTLVEGRPEVVVDEPVENFSKCDLVVRAVSRQLECDGEARCGHRRADAAQSERRWQRQDDLLQVIVWDEAVRVGVKVGPDLSECLEVTQRREARLFAAEFGEVFEDHGDDHVEKDEGADDLEGDEEGHGGGSRAAVALLDGAATLRRDRARAHERSPRVTRERLEEQQAGGAEGVEVSLVVVLAVGVFDEREELDAQDGVYVNDDAEEGGDVEESRDGLDDGGEEVADARDPRARALEQPDEAQDAHDTQDSEQHRRDWQRDQLGARAAVASHLLEQGREHDDEIEAAPRVVEVKVAKRKNLQDGLGVEKVGEQGGEPVVEGVEGGVLCDCVKVAGEEEGVCEDDAGDDGVERLCADHGEDGAAQLVARRRGRALLALVRGRAHRVEPLLLRGRHHGAAFGPRLDPRECVDDGADKEVEREESSDEHPQDEEKRRGAEVVALGRVAGRRGVHA